MSDEVKTVRVGDRDIEVVFQEVPLEEFARLWNMPDDGYHCEGCGAPGFSEPGWCKECVEMERARFQEWNSVSRGNVT